MPRIQSPKLSAVILFAALTSCASVETLQRSPSCQVWEEQAVLSPRSVEVEGLSAKYTGKCTIPFVWCQWAKTEYNPMNHRVSLEGNAIFEGKREVASLHENSMRFDESFTDVIAKSSPALIDSKEKLVKRTVTLTLMGLDKSSEEVVHFNGHCSAQQAGIGALALWAGKSKDAGH